MEGGGKGLSGRAIPRYLGWDAQINKNKGSEVGTRSTCLENSKEIRIVGGSWFLGSG